MSVSDGTIFKTSSVLEENHSRLSKNVPRYLYSSTIYHRFLLDDSGDCLICLCLGEKVTIISLVLLMLRSKTRASMLQSPAELSCDVGLCRQQISQNYNLAGGDLQSSV